MRERGPIRIFYVKGKIEQIEINYNLDNIRVERLDLEYNWKIGSFELETYTETEDTTDKGIQILSAGAWKTKDKFYSKHLLNSSDNRNILLELIDEIFNQKLYSYTF